MTSDAAVRCLTLMGYRCEWDPIWGQWCIYRPYEKGHTFWNRDIQAIVRMVQKHYE